MKFLTGSSGIYDKFVPFFASFLLTQENCVKLGVPVGYLRLLYSPFLDLF